MTPALLLERARAAAERSLNGENGAPARRFVAPEPTSPPS